MPIKKKAATKRKAAPRKKAVMVISNQQGEGIMDIFKGINKFLRKTKIISGLAGVASAIPGLQGIAAPVGAISGSLGYGKKKRAPPKKKKGRGLNPGGGGLSLAGQRNPIR